MKWAQAMDKKKKMLIAITIVSGITISGIALASNGWFSFDKLDLSIDNLKLTDTITLEDLPLWLDASVTVTGSGYIGQEHNVEISIWHTRPHNSIYEATGAFSLALELPEGTIVEPIISGIFSDLRNYETHDITPYTWIPSAGAELYTIALVIDGVVWNEVSEYTIISSAGDRGTISPLGKITVYEGDDQTFTITADPGYELADLVIDEFLSIFTFGMTEHTFYDVQMSYRIHATFSTIPPTGTYSESNTTIDLSSRYLNGWNDTIETCTFNGETDLIIVEGQFVDLTVTVADDGTYQGWFWSYHFEAKRPDGSGLHVIGSSSNGHRLGDSPQATVSFTSEAGIWHIILIVDSVAPSP